MGHPGIEFKWYKDMTFMMPVFLSLDTNEINN